MLIDALRARIADPNASSFQLMGEDLAALTAADLRAVADAHARALAALPADISAALAVEEATLAAAARTWLRRHNRYVHGRIAGYLALGRACDLAYPWPVVAIIGVSQVLSGMDRNRVYGLLARGASLLGRTRPARIVDVSDDILRRTNRGIFADSVPTVLRALRADRLRRDGNLALAAAVRDGVAALLWDDESRTLCRAICDGLALPAADSAARFRALAATTLRHFSREQAIFSYHLGRGRYGSPPKLRAIPAPVIERGALVFRPFALPAGFDFRDHDARVELFGRAFVTSITQSPADYAVASAWAYSTFEPLTRADSR